LKLTNKEIELNINIDDDLINRIYNYGMEHYPKEFGGFLIGNYSEDLKTVYIKETLLPKKFKASKFSFERSVEGVKETLEKYYNAKERMIYVGEWHTHPDNKPTPSSTDIKALEEIANHDEVKIKNPILLIMGIDKTKKELGFFVHFKNKIYKYEYS
jgi:[CysO sulfur-carrier protein]-S-L-cysteine hydrolase